MSHTLTQAAILIIDDNPANVMLLEGILENEGYTHVTSLTDSRRVEEQLAREKPDLVLLDIRMPHLDGHQVLAMMRERYGAQTPPVIVLTAETVLSTRHQALELGAADFLIKPFDILEVQQRIRNQLMRYLQFKSHQGRAQVLERTLAEKDAELLEMTLEERMAAEVHRYMVNHRPPLPAVQVRTQAAAELCGDLVVWGESADGCLYAGLLDATGHGTPAAISLLPVMMTFEAAVCLGRELDPMVRECNRLLDQMLPDDRFVAAAFLHYCPAQQQLCIWNGGMPDIWLLNAEGRLLEQVRSADMPLGIMPDALFNPVIRQIDPAQVAHILMFSDGVLEQRDEGGVLYGQEGLKAALAQVRGEESLIDGIQRHLQGFRGACEAEDDISLCCISLADFQPSCPRPQSYLF